MILTGLYHLRVGLELTILVCDGTDRRVGGTSGIEQGQVHSGIMGTDQL